MWAHRDFECSNSATICSLVSHNESMDALSRLLTLYPLRTALDVRCQFGAPWLLEHEGSASGIAPYHVVVRGSASVDAGAARGLALAAGDIVVFPHGSAHRLYIDNDGGTETPLPLVPVAGHHVVALMSNHGPGAATDVLCGEFRFASDANAGLLAALPPVIIVRTADRPEAAGLHHLLAMLQIETETPKPGASARVASRPAASARRWVISRRRRSAACSSATTASGRASTGAARCKSKRPSRKGR